MDDLFEIFEVFGIGEGLMELVEALAAVVGVVVVLALLAALVVFTDVGVTGLVLAAVIALGSAGVGFVAGTKVGKAKSRF